jgi:hypothetical protein
MDLIRSLLNDVRATIAEARAFFEASLPANERRSSFVALQRTDALVAALPTAQRPPRRVLIIDDYDLLCRNWEWKPVMSARVTYSPEALVRALVDHASHVVDRRVILAGESLRRNNTDLSPRRGSKLLIGPATLAERESFLTADSDDIPGLWSGLYEESVFLRDKATRVRLMPG